jgi:hypothetical protein
MPELTTPPAVPPTTPPGQVLAGPRRPLRQHPWLPVALQGLAVLVMFTAAGAGAGWLWQHLWDPPTGVVADHVWYTDEAGLRSDFSATGLYVVIALLAGLVVGGLAAVLFDRAEVGTLLAVLAGSALAAWLMWKVGVHYSAVDPHEAAKTAADGTKLPGNLHVSGAGRLSWDPRELRVPAAYLSFPVGALSALTVVFLGLSKRGRGRD